MKENIAHLQAVCQDWTRELKFYKTEVPFFIKRLEEIVLKNTKNEILSQVEHFENKFRIMNFHYSELVHDLKLLNKAIVANSIEKPNYRSVKMRENDNNLEELMQFTADDYTQTKKEFHRFLSKYL